MRACLAMLALLIAVPASAQTFPPLTGRVVDAAKLLSAEQVAQIEQVSAAVETASSRQLVVATIPDLQGYPIEDYGYKLGRAWKIGQQGANNGVVLIVAPTERKVRIEVGYGLEPVVTDAISNQIIEGAILPRFRDKDMAGGIVAGAQALGEQLKLPLEEAEARAQAAATAQTAKSKDGGGIIVAFWIAVLLFIVLRAVFARKRGKKFRRGAGPVILWGGGSDWNSSGGSSWGSGSSWGGGGGGGFSGGGGSFGGGGASGSW